MPPNTDPSSDQLTENSSRPARYWVGVLAFVASLLARLALSPVLGTGVPYLFFIPGIVLSAWYGGLGSGLVTTALSAIAAAYLVHSQVAGFSTAATLTWVIFVCIGSFLSWLNHAFRRSELRAINELKARKQYEEALRTSEERLTFALQAGGGVGTWDWDIPSGRMYCDPRFAALYSVDAERAVAGSISVTEFLAAIDPADSARVDESIRHAVRTGGDFAEEYRILQPDGSVRWVYARGRCHLNDRDSPTRFPGVAFDISDLKRAEEELKRSNEELKRLNRELEEFAYVASHDLQEPLRMVNVYTQLLLKRLGEEDEHINVYAGFIRGGVTRMDALLRDLLTFSRTVHTLELPVGNADLTEVLNEALAVLNSHIEESAAMVEAEKLPIVRGETAQLTHVFQNLLSNALKYRKPAVKPEIHISASRQADSWTIAVRDNGIGFEQRYASQIFGLFKRLHKNEFPGTGLGLAICERIIERYGGRIWAEGRPGEGATFFVSLPSAD